MQEYEDAGLDCRHAGFCWMELGSEYCPTAEMPLQKETKCTCMCVYRSYMYLGGSLYTPVRVVDWLRDGRVHPVGESSVDCVEAVDARLDVPPLTAQLLLSSPLCAAVREPVLDARFGKVEFRGESLARKHVRVVSLLELCEEDKNSLMLNSGLRARLTKLWWCTVPRSRASICSCVKDVRFRCSFLLRRMRISSASPFWLPVLPLSEVLPASLWWRLAAKRRRTCKVPSLFVLLHLAHDIERRNNMEKEIIMFSQIRAPDTEQVVVRVSDLRAADLDEKTVPEKRPVILLSTAKNGRKTQVREGQERALWGGGGV